MANLLHDIGLNLKSSLQNTQLASLNPWVVLLSTSAVAVATWALFGQARRQNDSKKEIQRPRTGGMSNPNTETEVRVSRIFIHPIKSCKGISVEKAAYTPEGLEFDRIWAIIDAEKQAIITARQVAEMVLIATDIQRDDTLPHLGKLVVSFPEGSECKTFAIPLRPTEEILQGWKMLPQITIWPTHGPVDGYICESLETNGHSPSPSEELSRYMGRKVHLVYKGPRVRESDPTEAFPDLKATAKYQDMYPLLVLSEESSASVDEELRKHVGTQGIDERWKTGNVDIRRFRANILVSGAGPFAEDGWGEIAIGSKDAPGIALVSRCTRCLLPNVSPETGTRDAAVPYKVLMKFRTGLDSKQKLKPCVGCNGVPSGNGVVRVGDYVHIRSLWNA